jgi:hypothetical protein
MISTVAPAAAQARGQQVGEGVEARLVQARRLVCDELADGFEDFGVVLTKVIIQAYCCHRSVHSLKNLAKT